MKRIASILACVSALAALRAFAWGSGHDVVAEVIAARLPEKYKAVLSDKAKMKQFIHDSHYPDSWDPPETNRFGKACTERLGAMGFTRRHFFHSYRGRAALMMETIQAIRDNDVDRVLLLISSYAHTVADAIALNHDPLIHFVSYGWAKSGLDVEPPLPFDAVWLKSTPRATAVLRDYAAKQDIKDRGRTFKEELLAIARQDVEGMKCMEMGPAIIECGMRLYRNKDDTEAADRLALIYSELVCWASSDTLRMLAACERFAASDETYSIDQKNDFKAYAAEELEYLSKRPMEKDAWTRGLLPKSGRIPKIGVVYDNSGRFGGGFLPWGDRILSAQIAGSLLASKKDAALYDVRKICKGEVDASKTPLLIVPANRIGGCFFGSNANEFFARLNDYRKAGGKILWIGNHPPKEIFPWVDKHIMDSGAKVGFGDYAFFVPNDEVLSCRIKVPSNGRIFAVIRRPKNGGWSAYNSTKYFERLSKDVEPVIVSEAPCGKRVIGVVCRKDGTAFLPSNIMLPYVLTDEKPQLDPLVLSLDSAGSSILDETVSMMCSGQKE